MSINLFRPKYETEECLQAIRKVLESGWTGPGSESKQFEQEWCRYTGAKNAHFLNSATAALHIAVRCLDLPPNSPILTTPLTFVSTNAVICYENHLPVFVDINDDLSLDADDFLNKMERYRAQAGLWVHHSGHVSYHFEKVMSHLSNEKSSQKFQMIEDCAHAAGASYSNGSKVGSRNDTTTCFSFHAVKTLPTFDSGMICHGSETYIERARRLAWLGIDKDTYTRTSSSGSEIYKWKYDVPELGWKYNGNDIAACIANVQIKYLDRDNAYRKQIYNWYQHNFSSSSTVKIVPQGHHSSHHLVVARIKNRDEVIASLKAHGIAPGVHYLPNNEFPIFRKYYTLGQCPNLEKIAPEIISLPNHLLITKSDVDRICEVVLESARS